MRAATNLHPIKEELFFNMSNMLYSLLNHRIIRLFIAGVCLWAAFAAPSYHAKPMAYQQQPRVRAPELDGGRGWLNTDKPLSLAALKGKVVLLDFWTYGCINCIHIIPDLQRLEAKYPNQLVVIGVHSAKFENERDTENIRRIVMRYEIEHPVVNDADMKIWENYAVRAWPTRILLDPAGYIVGELRGEGGYDALDQAIATLISDFRKRGELNETPLKLTLERAQSASLPLAFPGKVLADAAGGRLFIADSNHNRIVITDLNGNLRALAGTGLAGKNNGSFAEATFNRPQGLALDGDALYVADTENHLLRRLDLTKQTVSTVAGTGQQSQTFGIIPVGPALTTPLSSPWDLQIAGRSLYIAMAGPHQLWRLDLDANTVGTFAGSGREARQDGPRLADNEIAPLRAAAFAQPSGITTDGKRLYVADSESNIIRAVGLDEAGTVETLAGGDLFDFGDQDGEGDDVRLQHPLGVAWHDGKVFIADTYNHKIKLLDPLAHTVKTFLGNGKPGQQDGANAGFYEPGGLSIANGQLYVADTNNHAIRVIDIAAKRSATLKINGLTPPVAANLREDAPAARNAEEITVATQKIGPGADISLVAEIALPAGYHLNESAPQRYQISVEKGASVVALAGPAQGRYTSLPVRVPLRSKATGTAQVRLAATVFYCRTDNTGACYLKTLVWRIPINVGKTPNAARAIKLSGKVTVAE